MAEKPVYIKNKAGRLYIVKGDVLDTASTITLINELIRTVKQAQSLNLEMSQLIDHDESILFDKWAAESEWVFPQKRSQVYQSGLCVYFVTTPNTINAVKIGFTYQLAVRSSTIGRENKSKPIVHAFIKTPHAKQLEGLLHGKFAYCHIDREWFKAEPVLAYISQFRH